MVIALPEAERDRVIAQYKRETPPREMEHLESIWNEIHRRFEEWKDNFESDPRFEDEGGSEYEYGTSLGEVGRQGVLDIVENIIATRGG